MHSEPQLASLVKQSLSRRGVDVATVVTAALVAVLGIYWKTTLSMVAIWTRSETFAHGFVVIPLFLFLLWRRRETLATIEPKPFWPAVLAVFVMGAVWLVGALAKASVVAQLAVIAMIPAVVWTVLGTKTVTTLAIPFAFLFFAVPFGEALLPTLMDWTADFAVAALRGTGVPVYREGNFFSIPSGNWSVVEACSGLRYLIASLMVGFLYAYISYRSFARRAAFIAASIIVPIVANWLRVYIIVMVGHLSNNQLAVGVDHLIYGWVFFGVVMLLLFWVGSYWREDADESQAVAGATRDLSNVTHSGASRSTGEQWAAILTATALLMVWQPLLAQLGHVNAGGEARLQPVQGSQGWVPAPADVADWHPALSGTKGELRQSFVKDGQHVGVYVGFYRDQTEDSKAVTSVNRLVGVNDARWRLAKTGVVTANIAGAPLKVRSALIGGDSERLAAWQWYWVDGHVTSSDYAAKLYQVLSMLQGHGDATAWVVVYTKTNGGEEEARPTLQAFTTEMGPAIEKALRRAASE